nr:hypothetical protein [Kibdelosporangium sp. MJ126-NF4]CEL22154.1 hypothetical protein [Kibdelosporangium sp. MJ126-NF4]CTQ92935.1 hypothetical protein [Kibdelosporangium sp. MJ126-NF4]CTQ95572.1 hypothetical protein [Kibdelosporangium sp. MJ126-NF4]
MTTPRRRLSDHVYAALNESVTRVLSAHPHRRAELAQWLETVHERLIIRAVADRRTPGGRIDTRSLRMEVYVLTTAGAAPLVSVRARDLLDADGNPVNARTTARHLLWQNGHGIPDTPAELIDQDQTEH